MRRKYFILLLILLLVLCSCDKKQPEQNKNEIERESETFIYTEVKQDDAIKQKKDSSIYIMHQDFDVFTQEENEAIKVVDGVGGTEYYGGASRTKYYYQLGKDYNMIEGYNVRQVFQATDQEIEEHFIRSSGNIVQEDLKEGRLPKADNEIVLYTSDSAMNGKTIEMYFLCNDLFSQEVNAWDSYIEKDMIICGILKEKTEQIYFSDSFCDMMGKIMTEFVLKKSLMNVFEIDDHTEGFVQIQDKIGPKGNIELGDLRFQEVMEWNGEYDLTIYSANRGDNMLIYIDDSLNTSEVLLPRIYLEHWDGYIKEKYDDQTLCYSLYDVIKFSYNMPERWIFSEEETKLGLLGYSTCSEVTMLSSDQKPMNQELLLGIRDFSLKSGQYTMAVSRKLFDAMYPYQGSKVIEVYIEEGKEDRVKEKLAEQGYVEYEVQTYKRKDKTSE